MNIKCLIASHAWDGCKCRGCCKTHHDWSKDCEKCSRCGSTRANAHQWDGCKCRSCGKTQDKDHNWSNDCEKCARCGLPRANAHNWLGGGCKCWACGKTQDKDHDWSKDCEKCERCGLVRVNFHQWDGTICKNCGVLKKKSLQERQTKMPQFRIVQNNLAFLMEEQGPFAIQFECEQCGKTVQVPVNKLIKSGVGANVRCHSCGNITYVPPNAGKE